MVTAELILPKNPNKILMVHLVPHTHNDVGWIKTPDAYFNGFGQRSSPGSVRQILDSALE